MNNATRILIRLAEREGTTAQLERHLGNIPPSTLAVTLTKVRAAGHIDREKVQGIRAVTWRITPAGRAHLRSRGLEVDPRSMPSDFGYFGARIGRVRSVFELGQAGA